MEGIGSNYHSLAPSSHSPFFGDLASGAPKLVQVLVGGHLESQDYPLGGFARIQQSFPCLLTVGLLMECDPLGIPDGYDYLTNCSHRSMIAEQSLVSTG